MVFLSYTKNFIYIKFIQVTRYAPLYTFSILILYTIVFKLNLNIALKNFVYNL